MQVSAVLPPVGSQAAQVSALPAATAAQTSFRERLEGVWGNNEGAQLSPLSQDTQQAPISGGALPGTGSSLSRFLHGSGKPGNAVKNVGEKGRLLKPGATARRVAQFSPGGTQAGNTTPCGCAVAPAAPQAVPAATPPAGVADAVGGSVFSVAMETGVLGPAPIIGSDNANVSGAAKLSAGVPALAGSGPQADLAPAMLPDSALRPAPIADGTDPAASAEDLDEDSDGQNAQEAGPSQQALVAGLQAAKATVAFPALAPLPGDVSPLREAATLPIGTRFVSPAQGKTSIGSAPDRHAVNAAVGSNRSAALQPTSDAASAQDAAPHSSQVSPASAASHANSYRSTPGSWAALSVGKASVPDALSTFSGPPATMAPNELQSLQASVQGLAAGGPPSAIAGSAVIVTPMKGTGSIPAGASERDGLAQPDSFLAAANAVSTTAASANGTPMLSSSMGSGGTAAPSVAGQGAPPETADSVAGALAGARLLRSFGQSELQLHLNAQEFGRVSVHAALGRDAVAAQITLANADLGAAVAAHLPTVEQKLSGDHSLRATITVSTGAESSRSGQRESGGGQPGANPQPSPRISPSTIRAQAPASAPITAAAAQPIPGGRLDIRI